MSHFTVMVVGEDADAQLAPFHEFECTGLDDEYVVDIDKFDEARKRYEEDLTDGVRNIETGEFFPFFDEAGAWVEEFSRPASGEGFFNTNRREKRVPEGYVEATMPTMQRKTFQEYIEYHYGYKPRGLGEDKFGYIEVNEIGEVTKVIDRTNPSAKWDWYAVGGRWGDFFTLKDGTKADVARKGDVDVNYMRGEAGAAAGEQWDKAHAAIAGRTFKTWAQCREESGDNAIDVARAQYNTQPAVIDFGKGDFGWTAKAEDYLMPREEYVERARQKALMTFAFVKDKMWNERGDMGWWGCVSDEKPVDEWVAAFNKMFDELPDNTLLTLVDCHI